MAWPTAQDVVTQAAIELGLQPSLVVADPFSSLDPNILQLVALLRRGGTELVDEADWSHLRREWSFTTTSGAQVYSMPPDWRDMADQTGWNRSSRLPMTPLSAQQWSYLAARNTGIVFNVLFRPAQGVMMLYPPTATATNLTIAMEYKSSWWVQASGATFNPSGAGTYVAGDFVQAASTYFLGINNSIWRCTTGGITNGQYTLRFRGTVTGFNTGLVTQAATGATILIFSKYASGGYTYLLCLGDPSAAFIAGSACTDIASNSATPDAILSQPKWATALSGPLPDEGGVTWNFVGFAGQVATTDTVNAGADIVMFDKSLLVAKLRLLFLQAKGLDWSQAERDYRHTFERVLGNDVASPVLSLGGAAPVLDPLLGIQNYPITGFGT